MNSKITAQYLPILAKYVAAADVRYYLMGFLIEPAPENIGGIYLVATNGHHAVVIHDKEGTSDGKYIYNVPKRMLADCKPYTARKDLIFGKKFVGFDGAMATLVDNSGPVRSERCTTIDGKFLDWRKVTYHKSDAVPTATICMNPELLAHIDKAMKSAGIAKHTGVMIKMNGEHNCIAIVPDTPERHEILFLVMPMRTDAKHDWTQKLDQVWLPTVKVPDGFNAYPDAPISLADGKTVEVFRRDGSMLTGKPSMLMGWEITGATFDIVGWRLVEVKNHEKT